jgi:hypothetical protein
MGVCSGCTGRKIVMNTYLNDFWGNIAIRETPVDDFKIIIDDHFDSLKKGKSEDLLNKPIFKNNSEFFDKEIVHYVLRKAQKESEEKGGDYYFYLSLLFLCKKDILLISKNIQKYCGRFPDLMTYSNIYNSKLSLSRSKIMSLVEFHINMVTLSAVEKVFEQSPNRKEYEDQAAKIFSINQQKKFIGKYFKLTLEYVELDSFLQKYYDLLTDDNKIREEFVAMSKETDAGLPIKQDTQIQK